MPYLLLKSLPRYECLQEAAKRFPELDPSACEVFLQLLRTGDELASAQQACLGQYNISHGRFTVLMLLIRGSTGSECGEAMAPCNPAELAERAGVTRATMTGLIDTLEKDGYVKREPDPSDRRMMSVQLTPKGEAFMRGILPDYFHRIAVIMKELNQQERKTLVQLLGKVAARAAEAHQDPATEAAG